MAKKKDSVIQGIDPVLEAADMESPTQQLEENSIATAFKNPRTGVQITLSAVGGVVLGMVIIGGMMTMRTAYQTADKVDMITIEQQAQEVEPHTHTWAPNYINVHHDAVYADVWHEPVYSHETTYHTVCNDCKKVIDGIAADHIADTGHSGYTTNVPLVNEVLVQAGYTEPVLVQEAWDEVKIDGATCMSCGQQLSAEQVAADENIVISIGNAEDAS